jgi:molybdopterin-containing oxidoreductase family iron-sulfur binding subunit
MKAGSVHTLIMSVLIQFILMSHFAEGLKKVTTSVSLALKEHETALLSTICASSSLFEAWMI